MFQNISQISDRWGRDRAETIVANHRVRLFGSGIGDRATLEYLRAVLGEEEIERISTHRQRLELDLGSRTYSHDFKPLAAPNRIEADGVSRAIEECRLIAEALGIELGLEGEVELVERLVVRQAGHLQARLVAAALEHPDF